MTFPHPLRGTCIPECPSFGVCHCGCGGTPCIAGGHQPGRNTIKGMPRVFLAGHHARVLDIHIPGCWQTHGADAEKVRLCLHFLHDRYGSWGAVVDVCGITEGWLRSALYGPRLRVHPGNAARVAAAVVAHREARDPWRWTEEPERRLPTPEESDGRRRNIAATEKAFYRARRAEAMA